MADGHPDMRERFLKFAEPEPMSGCWLWTGHVDGKGYGRFQIRSYESEHAHRAAWEIFRGEVPPGLHVLHRCDVKCCVNPYHLFVGTNRDNVDDKVRKGRAKLLACRGSRHGRSKLTEQQIHEIRASRKTPTELGKIYGVSRGTIWSVRTRRFWTHVQ